MRRKQILRNCSYNTHEVRGPHSGIDPPEGHPLRPAGRTPKKRKEAAVAKSLEGNPGIPDVARLKDLERECAEAATQHGELTVRCVVIGDELWEKDYNKADVILE